MDRPSPEGFLGIGIGMAGESGGEVDLSRMEGRVGDAGRLANELVVGVLGVLEGLGPGSTGRVGKFLNKPPSLRLSRAVSLEGAVDMRGRDWLFVLGGMEGTICHSSSSSIEGKCCENSVK
jgi:hypothetical protein